MALGIFAFAILPVIGLMGVGLNVSKESSDASTMTQICRLAEAWVANTPADPATMYFSNDGEEDKTTKHSNSVYQANFTVVSPPDSAQGLLARKLWQMTVVKQGNTNVVMSKRILEISKDPAQLKGFFWP